MKLETIIKNPYKIILSLGNHELVNWMPDKMYISLSYRARMGKKLDWNNLRTFNEKLQWLKLYDHDPRYTQMVDKLEVKSYVGSIIGEEYIIPTIGAWDSFEEIDFSKLPKQFVLKCTHDSGGIFICKDKDQIDYKALRKKFKACMKRNFFYHSREWPYKNVKPRIIAEKYMEDTGTSELRDYKFFCFNGVAKCYKVDFDRFVGHKANYFTPDGELMKIGEEVCPPDFDKELPVPANLEKMKELAAKLSETQPFLRTDFYDVDGKVYFGELTFYPASGFGKFIYEGNDELLGSWIKLPENVGGGYYLIYKDMLCMLDTAVAGAGEQYKESEPLRDYKIYTFDGKAKLCMINQDRGIRTKADYFDRDYNWLDITWGYDHANVLPEKPQNYELMYELAEKLAVGTPELRVDFYEVNGRVYFGELTFFDGSGFDKIEPIEWDYKLGSMVRLPQKNE